MAEQLATLAIAVKTGDLKTATKELDKLQKQGLKAEKATDRLTSSSKKLGSTLTSLPALFTAVVGSMAINKVIKYADEMTNVESKLKLVTKSTQQLTQAQDQLFKIAQNTRASFTDTVDLYSRMARSTENLNISQKELLGITDTINKALIVSGGSAESMNAALVQLGQGFASGTLRGEELNSVMEQTPRLAKAIADGMGISVGELRKLGAEGKITADTIINALKGQADAVNAEFGKMTMTIDQSFTQIDNSFVKLVGSLDSATGLSSGLASNLSDISKSIDDISSSVSEYQTEIDYVIAGIDRTIDYFNLFYETAENTAQIAAYSISGIVYSAIEPVMKISVEAAKALESIGVGSEETVKKNEASLAWVQKQINANKNDTIGALKEISDAQAKTDVTIAERVELSQLERKILEQNKFIEEQRSKATQKTNNATKDLNKTLKNTDNSAFNDLNKISLEIYQNFEKTRKEIGLIEVTGISGKLAPDAMSDAEFLTFVKRRTEIQNQELKKSSKTIGEYFGQQLAENSTNALQSMLDGDFNFKQFASGLAKATGQAIVADSSSKALSSTAQKSDWISMVAGVVLMGVGSVLGKDNKPTFEQKQAEMVDKWFKTFIDNLELASKRLEDFGNVGSSTALQITQLETERARLLERATSETNSKTLFGEIYPEIRLLSEQIGELTFDELSKNIDFTSKSTEELIRIQSKFNVENGKAVQQKIEEIALLQKEEAGFTTNAEKFREIFPNIELASDDILTVSNAWQDAISGLFTDEDYKNLIDFSDALDELNQRNEKATQTLIENTYSQAKFADSLNGTKTALDFAIEQIGGLADGLPTTTQGLIDLRKAFLDNDGSLSEYEQAVIDATLQTDFFVDKIEEVKTEFEDLSSVFEIVENDIQKQVNAQLKLAEAYRNVQTSIQESVNNINYTGTSWSDVTKSLLNITSPEQAEKALGNINTYFSEQSSLLNDYASYQADIAEKAQAQAQATAQAKINAERKSLSLTISKLEMEEDVLRSFRDFADDLRISQLSESLQTGALKTKFESAFADLNKAVMSGDEDMGDLASRTTGYASEYLNSLKETSANMSDYIFEQSRIADVLGSYEGTGQSATIDDLRTQLENIKDISTTSNEITKDFSKLSVNSIDDLRRKTETALDTLDSNIVNNLDYIGTNLSEIQQTAVNYLGESSPIVVAIQSLGTTLEGTLSEAIKTKETTGAYSTLNSAQEYLKKYTDVADYFKGTGTYSDVDFTKTSIYKAGVDTPEEWAKWHYENFGKSEGRTWAFANGGIVTSPTMGLIGEAGYNEAVIPLKNPNDPLGQEAVLKELVSLRKELAGLRRDNDTYLRDIENNTRETRIA